MQLFLRVLPFQIRHQPRLKPCLRHLWPIPFYPRTNEACWRLTLTFFPRQTSQLLFFLKKVQLLVLLRQHLLKSKTWDILIFVLCVSLTLDSPSYFFVGTLFHIYMCVWDVDFMTTNGWKCTSHFFGLSIDVFLWCCLNYELVRLGNCEVLQANNPSSMASESGWIMTFDLWMRWLILTFGSLWVLTTR